MYSLPTPLFSWIFTPYMEPLAYISDRIRVGVGVVVVVIRSTYALVKIENRSRKLSYAINTTESESEDSERFQFFQFRLPLRRLWSSENCPKIPEINSRAYLFQRPFSRSLYSEGLISTEGNLRFQIAWARLIFRSKFTVFALVFFVFKGNFPSTRSWLAYIFWGNK